MMLSMVVGFMLKLPRLLEQHKIGFSSSLTSKVVGVYPTAFFFSGTIGVMPGPC